MIQDPAISSAFEVKCAEEVEARKAWWTGLSPDSSIITARFPVHEGVREDTEGN